MEGDLVEAADVGVVDLRHTVDRARVEPVVSDDPQATRALGHQHGAAVREEGETPGVFEPGGDRDDADPLSCLGVEHERPERRPRRRVLRGGPGGHAVGQHHQQDDRGERGGPLRTCGRAAWHS